jgi:uncharacterized membrane protein/protein-disulfide isomerase
MKVGYVLFNFNARPTSLAAIVMPANTQQFVSHRQPLGTVVLWLVRLLALVAAGLAGYLTWVVYTHGTVAGCGMGDSFDCDRVLASSWSKLLEFPVAPIGAGVYAAIFLVSWLVGVRSPRVARFGIGMLVLLVTAAAVAAAWFIFVQSAYVGEFCIFCMGVHACGLSIAALVGVGLTMTCALACEDAQPVTHLRSALAVGPARPRRVEQRSAVTGYGQFALPMIAGIVAVGAMIAVQWFMPSKTFVVAKAGDLGGEMNLDPATADDNSDDPDRDPNSHLVLRPTDDEGLGLSNRVSDTDEEEAFGNTSDDPIADEDELAATGTFDDSTDELKDTSDDVVEIVDVSGLGSAPSRQVSVYRDQIKFDIYKQLYLGKPDAEHVVVELFDYTCQHCRKMHNMMRRASRRYGDQVVVVPMPIPMEASCNQLIRVPRTKNRGSCRLANLALAVGNARPARFSRFHNWLMDDDERVPDYGQALLRAYSDFGRTQIRNELSKSSELSARIQQNIQLYARLASGWQGEEKFGLPVLIVGDTLSVGGFEFETELFDHWEETLGVTSVR